MEAVSHIFYALIFLMFALLLPGVYCFARLTHLIRDRHPEVWQALGEPKAAGMSITTTAKMSRFLRKREFRSLGNRDVERYVSLLRVVEISYFACFAGFILLFLGALIAGLRS